MTNPNNAVGTNAAYSGRTSPNALNDVLASYRRGIVCGWACSPKSGMTIQLGGNGSDRDMAVAVDNAGNRLTINNRSGAPIDITLGGSPSTNNRIDAIVAYVDNPSIGDNNTTDNPTACGIIAVQGAVAANPTAPDDAQIRNAITIDGATGGIAYYVVLATVLVGTNVTTIGSGVITQGGKSYPTPVDNTISMAKLTSGVSGLIDPYVAGETFKPDGNIIMAGHLTSSSKTIIGTLTLPKRISTSASGVTATGGIATARGVAGYLISSASVPTTVTIDCSISTFRNQVRLQIRKTDDTAFNGTNNTPCSIQLSDVVFTVV